MFSGVDCDIICKLLSDISHLNIIYSHETGRKEHYYGFCSSWVLRWSRQGWTKFMVLSTIPLIQKWFFLLIFVNAAKSKYFFIPENWACYAITAIIAREDFVSWKANFTSKDSIPPYYWGCGMNLMRRSVSSNIPEVIIVIYEWLHLRWILNYTPTELCLNFILVFFKYHNWQGFNWKSVA